MFRRLMAPLLAAVFFAGTFGAISGCNTMAGAGQDIERGGRAIKDEARERR
jgi:entericidin B